MRPLVQIDRELDDAKRKDLVRQAEALFEQDPPLLPVSWEKINDGWFNYVKGHNPYNYFGNVGSCTSSLRINLPGSLVDCHSGQKGLDERARMASQRLSHPW